jgi:hypothetical protein
MNEYNYSDDFETSEIFSKIPEKDHMALREIINSLKK